MEKEMNFALEYLMRFQSIIHQYIPEELRKMKTFSISSPLFSKRKKKNLANLSQGKEILT
jgi:hypothetical protein